MYRIRKYDAALGKNISQAYLYQTPSSSPKEPFQLNFYYHVSPGCGKLVLFSTKWEAYMYLYRFDDSDTRNELVVEWMHDPLPPMDEYVIFDPKTYGFQEPSEKAFDDLIMTNQIESAINNAEVLVSSQQSLDVKISNCIKTLSKLYIKNRFIFQKIWNRVYVTNMSLRDKEIGRELFDPIWKLVSETK